MYDSEFNNLIFEDILRLSERLEEFLEKRNELNQEIKYLEDALGRLIKEHRIKLEERINKPREWKKPKDIAELSLESMYMEIGILSFYQDITTQMSGKVSPSKIFSLTNQIKRKQDINFVEKGQTIVNEILQVFIDKICGIYKKIEKLGLLDDLFDVYLFSMGYLMGQGISQPIATGIAGIIAKRGLKVICDSFAHT